MDTGYQYEPHDPLTRLQLSLPTMDGELPALHSDLVKFAETGGLRLRLIVDGERAPDGLILETAASVTSLVLLSRWQSVTTGWLDKLGTRDEGGAWPLPNLRELIIHGLTHDTGVVAIVDMCQHRYGASESRPQALEALRLMGPCNLTAQHFKELGDLLGFEVRGDEPLETSLGLTHLANLWDVEWTGGLEGGSDSEEQPWENPDWMEDDQIG